MDITVQYEIRQVQQVHEKKMSYDLHMLLFLTWTDERLIGLTDNTGCNPLFVNEGKKLWVPGELRKSQQYFGRKSYFVSISDVQIDSLGNINFLINLLHNEANFMIDNTGRIAAYMSLIVDNICKDMNFGAYPKDKHKCEFYISSITYSQAWKLSYRNGPSTS